MLKRWMVWGLIAIVLVATGCAGGYEQTSVRASYASPGAAVSVSYFYDALAPYGSWVEYPPYGWCWSPYDADPSWRPYSVGYWVYTDFGWTWVSNDPWGWAAYHYGRWLDSDDGWLWLPGTVWGPAWVAWRYDDAWVGWAPLPPAATWDVSFGLRFGDADRIPVSSWCFVDRPHMLDTGLRKRLASIARNVTLCSVTRDATRFESREGRPMNRGLDVAIVEKQIRRPVPRMKVVDVASPAQGRGRASGVVGVYRPQVRDAGTGAAPGPRQRGERVAVSDQNQRQEQESDRRRLDRALSEEQARLQREHDRDLHAQPPGAAIEEIRKRHAAEDQAFEDHAARQRHLLDQRMKKRALKPGRITNVDESGTKVGGKEKTRPGRAKGGAE